MTTEQIKRFKEMKKEYDYLEHLIKNVAYNKFYLQFSEDKDHSYFTNQIKVTETTVKIIYEKTHIMSYINCLRHNNGYDENCSNCKPLVDINEWEISLEELIDEV